MVKKYFCGGRWLDGWVGGERGQIERYFCYIKLHVSQSIISSFLKTVHNVEKHDIHIKSKFYKLELLGELVI